MNTLSNIALKRLSESLKSTIGLAIILLAMTACQDGTDQDHDHHDDATATTADHHDHGSDEKMVELSAQQMEMLDLKIGNIEEGNLSDFVRTNGQLKVPPQNKATVTAIIGANIRSVNVIPGEEVKKGQTLATVSHPDLIRIQTEYSQNANELEYLESEYKRQEKLLEEEVGSGKAFQRAKSDYMTMKGNVKGLESQFKQLNLNPESIKDGYIYEVVAIPSPIAGNVNQIAVNIGQYVAPETMLFEVIDNHHIHVDLMVYEKDIAKIEKGQKVLFHIESAPDREFPAEIFAVGTTFEQDPKAVSVHAEILGEKPKLLLPGMYVKGRIMLEGESKLTVPEAAVVREGEAHYLFLAEPEKEGDQTVYHFKPMEVKVGVEENGRVEITTLESISAETRIALNQAYFLLAEMEKGEGGHGHSH
jgi:cobalt-zinc-cadmium efflux system membrane fusion protein